MKSISKYVADMDKQPSGNLEEEHKEGDVNEPSEDKADQSSSSEESDEGTGTENWVAPIWILHRHCVLWSEFDDLHFWYSPVNNVYLSFGRVRALWNMRAVAMKRNESMEGR